MFRTNNLMKLLRLLLAAPCMAIAIYSTAGAKITSCPEGKECTDIIDSGWCYADIPDCQNNRTSTSCPITGEIGFIDKSSQLDWYIHLEMSCNSHFVAGEVIGPQGPENIFGGWPDYSTTRAQPWRYDMYNSLGASFAQIRNTSATRSPSCPVGFTLLSFPLRCEKDLVPDCDRNCKTRKPVLPFSQEKFLAQSDFSSADGLRIDRNYHSASRFPLNPSKTLFGPMWSTTWDQSLLISTNFIRALRADGTQVQFSLVSSEWKTTPGRTEELIQLAAGSSDDAAWEISLVSQVRERYSADGRLVGIVNPDGNHLVLTYNGTDQLIQVSDFRGRTIDLVWTASASLPRVQSIFLPDGGVLEYEYDTVSGRLEKVLHDQSVLHQFRYAESAHSAHTGIMGRYLLTGVIGPESVREWTYSYNSNGYVVQSGHASGIDTDTFSWSGNTIFITRDSGVERRQFQKVAGGWRPIVIDFRSCTGCAPISSRGYSYGADGFVSAETDALGTQTTLEYNPRGLVIKRVEAANRPQAKHTIETDWHTTHVRPIERRTLDADAILVARERWSLNGRGQVEASCRIDVGVPGADLYTCGNSASAPLGVRQTRLSYCEAADIALPNSTCPILGLLKSVDGPRTDVSDVTNYAYYPATDESGCASTGPCHRKGDLWTVTNALGHVSETLRYDRAGRVLASKDPNGVITEFTYHPRGWLLTRTVQGVTTPDDAVTTYTYDAVGQVTRVTQPDGDYLDYAYDAAHRLIAIEDALGNRIDYTLDAAGNRTSEVTKDANAIITRQLARVYDQLGRIEEQLDAQNRATAFTHDANGNQTAVEDALNIETRQTYDPLNRLKATIQDYAGLDVETGYTYDALDRLVTVTDPKGLDTQYTYDGLGNLIQLDSPDTGVTTYTYDAAGNRLTQTDARGVTATYTYDALNRITGISYPTPSLDVSYYYDEPGATTGCPASFPLGRLTRMKDQSGTTAYCHDRRGNLTRKQWPVGIHASTISYAYTLGDRLDTMTYPSGISMAHTRDAQGQLTALRGTLPMLGGRSWLVTDVAYRPFGPPSQISFEGGAVQDFAHDQNYWSEGVSGSALSLDFDLDATGNIIAANDPTPAAAREYSYDPLARLTRIEDGNTALIEGYSYDGTGNRLTRQTTGGTQTYGYPLDSHRLTAIDAQTRGFDAAGSMTSRGSDTFVYDDRQRLVQSGSATYTYNGRGERVGKGNQRFFYDESGRLIGEALTSTFGPIHRLSYVWLDDRPVAMYVHSSSAPTPNLPYAGQWLHIHTDHLGTPRAITRPAASNAVVWRWDFNGSAFGDHAPLTDPDGDSIHFTFNLRFPGQYYDAENGLHYNYFRDYEAGTGRYAESDPIGLGDGPSTYSYAKSRPNKLFDRLGLATYEGFDPDDEQRMRNANEEAIRRMQECTGCLDCGKDGYKKEYCIDEYQKQQVITNLRSAHYRAKPPRGNACGWHVGSNIAEIYPSGLAGDCCSLPATLAHEATHAAGADNGDRRPRYVEQECFGCTGRFGSSSH